MTYHLSQVSVCVRCSNGPTKLTAATFSLEVQLIRIDLTTLAINAQLNGTWCGHCWLTERRHEDFDCRACQFIIGEPRKNQSNHYAKKNAERSDLPLKENFAVGLVISFSELDSSTVDARMKNSWCPGSSPAPSREIPIQRLTGEYEIPRSTLWMRTL